MSSEAKSAKINSELAELLKIGENKSCAECGTIGPRWASVSLGVFLCLRCAGIHRGLGPHISKVKSLTLDTWTENQVKFMKETGNVVSRSYFEAKLPKRIERYTDDRQLVAFIKKKYEQKLYVNSDISFEQYRFNPNVGTNKPSQFEEEVSISMSPNPRMNTSINGPTRDTGLLDLMNDNPSYTSAPPKAPIKAPSNSQLLDIFSNPVSQPKNETTLDSIFTLTGNVQSGSNVQQSAFSGIDNLFYSQQQQQQLPNANSRVMTNDEILGLYNKPTFAQPAQMGYNSPYYTSPIRPVANNVQQMTVPNMAVYTKPLSINTQHQAPDHTVDHNQLLSNTNPSSKMSNAFSSFNRNGFTGNSKSYY